MELPKNITQIGEVDKTCKVYVEDYVVSYLKQLNQQAENKEVSVALYGRHEQESGIDYHFIYGACKVDQLPREVRHLSQAQMQEIERWRRKYFPELAFAGYRLLNGEMIEGFHICDQDICRYIAGYTQFYEKNDAMLAYMLDVRESVPTEHVDQEKYEKVKQRQEERRSAVSETADAAETTTMARQKIRKFPAATSENLQKMRLAAVGVFALLCLFGIATFREDTAGQIYKEDAQAVNASAVQGTAEKDKLIMEDKLEQALIQENQTEEQEAKAVEESEAAETSAESEETETETTVAAEQTAAEAQAVTETEEATETTVSQPESAVAQSGESKEVAAIPEAVAYVIQPGDTLIAISKRQYGTDARVKDICIRNKIKNPDDIKQGQVIMLPR